MLQRRSECLPQCWPSAAMYKHRIVFLLECQAAACYPKNLVRTGILYCTSLEDHLDWEEKEIWILHSVAALSDGLCLNLSKLI